MPKTAEMDEYEQLLTRHIAALREYRDFLDRNHTSPGRTTVAEALSVAGRLIDAQRDELITERSLKEKYDKDRTDLAVGLANAMAAYRQRGDVRPLLDMATCFETCRRGDRHFPASFAAGRN